MSRTTYPTNVARAPAPDRRRLSACEVDVLRDAAAGLTGEETARHLYKALQTVRTQRRSILLKLGARNMAHAISIVNEAAERPS
jgi:DNA-binding NarL/FixJ family response regulator